MNSKAPSLSPDNRATAQPVSESEPASTPANQTSETADELWAQCADLAMEPRILDRFSEDLERAGATGEDRIGRLLFLSIISRFLDLLVSIAVKGASSGGKSEMVNRVLNFFPEAAYLKITAMSEKVLAYDTENVKHRMLVITEASALNSDFASYLLRSLLSEGRIDYRVVEQKNGEWGCRHISREGPTGLIITTTRLRIHPENETRLLSVTIDDSAEQTTKVLKKLAERNGPLPLPNDLPDLEKWRALHQWIELQEHHVQIPYVGILAELFPSTAIRIRRDFGLVLNLIKAHAILHQATREKTPEGWIIATVDDYSVIRDLVDDLLAESLETSVPPAIRETVGAVKDLLEEFSLKRKALQHEGMMATRRVITQKLVANKLEIDKSTASRRIHQAIGLGYLINENGGKGRPMDLQIAEPMPSDRSVLPTAANVQRLMSSCTVARLPGGKEQTEADSEDTQENSARFEV
jgi:hypothetical protein